MIRNFRHKGLHELFEKGRSAGVSPELRKPCANRLEVLDHAEALGDLDITGFNPHPLRGTDPIRHAIAVSGPWRITFHFNEGDAYLVDLEQYH